MDYQHKTPIKILEIFKKNKIEFYGINYYAWPQTFGSTSGPTQGIGGSAMSTFTVEAFVCDEVGPTIYLCCGMFHFEDEKFKPFKHIKHWSKL